MLARLHSCADRAERRDLTQPALSAVINIMVEGQMLEFIRSLQESFGRSESAEREVILPGTTLRTKVKIDFPKNVVVVESTKPELAAERTPALAKVVNEANLQDSAGGYVYKDGKLIYRTSSIYAKGEFPEVIISQMLQIHNDVSVAERLTKIVQDSRPR